MLSRVKGVTIYLFLAPDALIVIRLVVILHGHRFAPLIHLDFPLQAVRIVRDNRKVIVHDLYVVDRLARQVHQLKFVCIVRVFTVY